MNKDDFSVDKIPGNYWCVFHISMDKPVACFPKKKQAVAFMNEQLRKFFRLDNDSPVDGESKGVMAS